MPAQSGAGQPVTATVQAPGVDLSRARIVWEAAGQEPAYSDTFTFTPARRGTNITYGIDGFDDPATQTTAGLLALPFRDTDVISGVVARPSR